MEIINEKLKETHRNWRNIGLGVRFKSCVTVQAPAQFGTHKNDSFQVFRIRNTLPPNTRRQHSTLVTQNSERSVLQESKCLSKRKPSFCKRSICRHPEARKTIRRARQPLQSSAVLKTHMRSSADGFDYQGQIVLARNHTELIIHTRSVNLS